jgi:hypothetical protein
VFEKYPPALRWFERAFGFWAVGCARH